MKRINNWEDLANEESDTHHLDIDLRYGCGWIIAKKDSGKMCDRHYLSTHAFYENQIDYSTKVLQERGFHVILTNE